MASSADLSVWSATERTLKKSSAQVVENSRWTVNEDMPPPAAPVASTLMPPPPVPVGAIKIKVKAKPSSSDQAIAALLPDTAPARPLSSKRMSPPPLPRAPERPVSTEQRPPSSAPPVVETTKKRKKEIKPVKDVVDDLLGEELDAMEREQPSVEDELLGPPQPKKIKLQKPPVSSDKEKRSKDKPTSAPVAVPHPPSNGEPVRLKLMKKPTARPSVVDIPATPTPQPVATVAPPTPRPADLPPTTRNNMPMNVKRAKTLLGSLTRVPAAIIVCPKKSLSLQC